MESLKYVERDGEYYFCFIEICTELLPEFSKSTIRNWLKALHIPCVNCTAAERVIFRASNATLRGSFGLVEKKNVTKLLLYKDENSKLGRIATSGKRLVPFKSKSSHTATLGCAASTSQESSVPLTIAPSTWNASRLVEYSSESESESEDYFGLASSSTRTLEAAAVIPTPPEILIPTPERDAVISTLPGEIDEPSVPSPVKSTRRRSSYKLAEEEITPVLKEEISGLRKFFCSPINPQRDSAEFSLSTIDKMIERILTFQYYAKHLKNIDNLCLNLCNDEDLVADFIVYLKDVRKLAPTTITSILTVFINVVKYNFRQDAVKSINAPQLIAYRRMQRQMSKEARFLTKKSKEGLSTKSSRKFYFSLILETLRNLKAKYFGSRGVEKARYLHDFVLIAFYLRAMPGRSNDIRLLKLVVSSETNPFDISALSSDNFIIFSEDSRVYLIQNDHKTSKSHGPSKLDLSDDAELIKFLRMYLEVRPSLMHAKPNDSFFLNCYGEPFASSSAVSNYLGNLFEREISMRVGTNKLRHAIVTYFQSLEESKDVSIRESLAALMKHSVRYQTQVYDDSSHDDKTKKGRDLLRKSVGLVDEGETDVANDDDGSDQGSFYADEEFEIRPQVNDICALLDPSSTAENIDIFLAKVARYSPDGQEAYLIHLEFVENSNNLYKIKPGKVWKESASALVYPIDIVFNASESAYELRTSAEDIYEVVHRA